jgi:hypothetical protein
MLARTGKHYKPCTEGEERPRERKRAMIMAIPGNVSVEGEVGLAIK